MAQKPLGAAAHMLNTECQITFAPRCMKYCHNIKELGRCSSVGIATAYGLDGPGIESWWGRDFPHLSRPALRPTQPPVQWVPGLPQR